MNDPKTADMRIREGRGIDGTSQAMEGDLRSQVIINYSRVLTSRQFVRLSRLEPPRRLKTEPKTVLKPIKDIGDSLSIGVPGQMPRKFCDVQGAHHRDWMEGGEC